MKSKPFILLFLVWFPGLISAQKSENDSLFICRAINHLSHDSLLGREAGTQGEAMAGNFIAGEFKKLKLLPVRKTGYNIAFYFYRDSVMLGSANIAGCAGKNNKKAVIIGAHYDHLGMGGIRSRSYGKCDVHNGADDNASGVALMLALARKLGRARAIPYNLIFIAFGAHEPGLFGSREMIIAQQYDSSTVAFMINLDMVGRADTVAPTLFVTGNSPSLIDKLRKTSMEENSVRISPKDPAQGDHSAFEAAGIPAIYITTGMHDDYHKISDDADKININGMLQILYLLTRFISEGN